MTTLTHCDGPGCERTKPEWPAFGDPPWHELEAGKDFCTTECLHRWSAPPITSEQGTPFYEHIANDAKIDLDKLEAMVDRGVIGIPTEEVQVPGLTANDASFYCPICQESVPIILLNPDLVTTGGIEEARLEWHFDRSKAIRHMRDHVDEGYEIVVHEFSDDESWKRIVENRERDLT